jgi:hypothetical protein
MGPPNGQSPAPRPASPFNFLKDDSPKKSPDHDRRLAGPRQSLVGPLTVPLEAIGGMVVQQRLLARGCEEHFNVRRGSVQTMMQPACSWTETDSMVQQSGSSLQRGYVARFVVDHRRPPQQDSLIDDCPTLAWSTTHTQYKQRDREPTAPHRCSKRMPLTSS